MPCCTSCYRRKVCNDFQFFHNVYCRIFLCIFIRLEIWPGVSWHASSNFSHCYIFDYYSITGIQSKLWSIQKVCFSSWVGNFFNKSGCSLWIGIKSHFYTGVGYALNNATFLLCTAYAMYIGAIFVEK